MRLRERRWRLPDKGPMYERLRYGVRSRHGFLRERGHALDRAVYYQCVDSLGPMPKGLYSRLPILRQLGHLMMLKLNFVSIEKSNGRTVASHAIVEWPQRLEKPLHGFGAQASISGPIEWSMNIKGAHELQAIEVALFVIRTMLSTIIDEWDHRDFEGEPLDFSYSWPPQT